MPLAVARMAVGNSEEGWRDRLGGGGGLTWRALYLFSSDGKQQKEYALPKLVPVSGIYISRDLPGVIVVRTDVNWAVSTSGYTPLLVPLEGS